ncbi:uncharacterized protein SPSC_00501 [Sporisorium scitamineum]|uniref:Zn(2)-C6 fungal-type domain-containing protein n=1 Tax=Sporisorium scitamineum TaxID=49012 RepID=A0A0F7S5Y3_9BASI|nr:uncharacterized protein SPSC_00501 [Sporisorium scitamineum]CDW94014.1 hypothetical protein [Sporisorium scitamineum]
MPSSPHPHPHRAPAHQLQHPEHASYSPSPRSTPLYSSTARSSQLYRTTSNASSPEAFSEHDPTKKGVSDYLGSSSSRTASTSRVSSAAYDVAPPPGPSPSKRRKASYDSSTVLPASHSSARTAKTGAIEATPTDANAADSKASTRVAKACQPCSTKKRRCDGRQPECSVCQVLGTPCTYNHTGLKRGPPKGFRSGPKESARAKLVRTLETTIRDLVHHLGKEDAGAEIVRVAGERELHVAEASSSANAGHRDGADPRQSADRNASSRIKIEHLTSDETASRFNTPRDSDGEADDPAAEAEEDVIGETRQGELVYRGSSSGIGILQRQHRAESPAPGVGATASRSVASSSSAPFAARSRETRGTGDATVHSKAPVFLPISSPRPVGDNATVSSHDRSPRLSKVTPRRDAHRLYPGSSRDGSSAASHASTEDPIVSDEENDRLFRYYWQGFHPFYPILYKPWFAGFSRKELRSSLEPSLLFAIYAIAACVVPGNASQSSAAQPEILEHKLNLERAQLFCRAAESYVFAKGLRPDIASIQTCWLLSLYSHGTGDLSRAWNFQNLASSMAVDMGLHRWPIYRPEIVQDRVQRETRIRIIWHCYIIDKLLCAEMGRPVGLRAKDIDVPLLSETEEDEFELWSDQTEMQSADRAGAKTTTAGGAGSGSPRRLHAPSCLNWGVHLFKIVERILDEVHSLRRKALLRRQGKEQVLADLDRQLTDWKEKLPPHLHLDDNSANDGPFPSFFALNLWYYTARLLLHRPFIPQDEGLTMSKVLENDSHRQSTIAANTICDLLEASSRDIVDRLSTDLGYCLFTAAVMFVFNARLPDGRIAADARRRYGLCMQWLKKLADTWPAASAHRLLLDGFAVVGEDASKQGSDARGGRRASVAALQAASGMGMAASSKVSSWIAETEGALQGVVQGGGQQDGVAAERQQADIVQAARQQGGSLSIRNDNVQTMTDWNGADAIMRNVGVGNPMDFAPGIFDVESFFWNENAAAAAYDINFQQLNSVQPVAQQQGFANQTMPPYANFNNGGGFSGAAAAAGGGVGVQMQTGPAPTAAPTMAYAGYGQHERNNSAMDTSQSMQGQLRGSSMHQSEVSMQPGNQEGVNATDVTGNGPAPVTGFSASPFAFNPSNQIGEFWSMLELPPAFLQQ